jgi:peptide/nickel transport system permease protein
MRMTDLFLIVPGIAILMVALNGLAGKELFGLWRPQSDTLIVLILSLLFWMTVAPRGSWSRPLPQGEGVRRGGSCVGRLVVPDHHPAHPSELRRAGRRQHHPGGRDRHSHRVDPFLPRFGVQPPDVSWGKMVEQARGSVGTPQAYLLYFPGLAILLTVLSINFLGDGLRDAFDPQSNR